jgi:hypothetical protein
MNWFRRDHRCPVCRANLITSPNVRDPIIPIIPIIPIPIVDNINISEPILNNTDIIDISLNTTQTRTTNTNSSRELLTNLSRNLGRVLGNDIQNMMQSSINTLASNPDIADLIYSFEIPLNDLSNNYI